MNAFNRLSILMTASAAFVGCVSRAPTECELDKRAGVYPSSFCGASTAPTPSESSLKGSRLSAKQAGLIPVRSQPLVKKVWASEHMIEGGHWMEGAWLYLEIEPSQWMGSAPRPTNSVSTPSSLPVKPQAQNSGEKKFSRAGVKQ